VWGGGGGGGDDTREALWVRQSHGSRVQRDGRYGAWALECSSSYNVPAVRASVAVVDVHLQVRGAGVRGEAALV